MCINGRQRYGILAQAKREIKDLRRAITQNFSKFAKCVGAVCFIFFFNHSKYSERNGKKKVLNANHPVHGTLKMSQVQNGAITQRLE